MIYHIKGKIIKTIDNFIIIEANGIGYQVMCPISDIMKLSEKKDEEVLIYTHLVHKEDSMNLYGFVSETNKSGFLNLLKVSGIGPKAAIKILSFYNINILYENVENEDIDSLKSIPGIGPKMAKKIIFDLKGVIPKDIENDNPEQLSNMEKDLINTMINLGYKEQDIKKSLNKIKPLSDNFEHEFKKLIKQMI